MGMVMDLVNTDEVVEVVDTDLDLDLVMDLDLDWVVEVVVVHSDCRTKTTYRSQAFQPTS